MLAPTSVLVGPKSAAGQAPACPTGALVSHAPIDPPAANLVSDVNPNQRRCDFYQNAAGSIDGVVFWGTERQFVAGFPACVESNPTFTVRFLEDNGGVPGDVACSHTLLATRTPTGITFNNAPVNRYEVALPAPCALTTGWVSIVGEGDAACSFFWLTSNEGDGLSYCQGCIQQVVSGDLSFCLLGQAGGVLGACCDEFTGGCLDNTDIVNCLAPYQRFEQGAACSELSEPCAAVAGACCRTDNTCDIRRQAECQTLGGQWLGLGASCDDCPLFALCPPGSLHAQLPPLGENFSGNTSEAGTTITRADNFTQVAGTITGLRFWGFDLDRVGNAWLECEEFDNTFVITFLTDYGGVPDVVVCSQTVTATRTPTGLFFGNESAPAELNQYDVTLTTPCVLTNGWVSIVGLGDPECWFLWMNSFGGDLVSHCDGCQSPQGPDLAVCLSGTQGGVTGACCDDATGTCTPDTDIELCALPYLRFAPGAACELFNPPCGVPNGACCLPGFACVIRSQEECVSINGTWQGAQSHCSVCPCEQPCPDGGLAENEPVCGPGFGDGTNGGCGAATPAFEALPLNITVCGSVGFTEVIGGGVVIDEDWFSVTAPLNSVQTWELETEFPALIELFDAESGCAGQSFAQAFAAPCDPVTLFTFTFDEPHEFRIAIRPVLVEEAIACGARYQARVSLPTACQPGDMVQDGTINGRDIQPFVECLLSGSSPGIDCLCADVDGMGGINLDDADALVTLLLFN